MTECKHRWVETNWGKPTLTEDRVIYHCVKCFQTRLVLLKDKNEN
jgi:hypothetical protein